MLAYKRASKWPRRIGLVVLLPLVNGLLSASAAPRVEVISPATDTWTSSNDVEFSVSVTDTLPAYAFIDWDNSLVGWWRAENDANDSSQYGNHATFVGNANTTDVDSRFGRVFSFAGSSDCLNLFNYDDMQFGVDDSFTISLWVKRTGTETVGIVAKASAILWNCFPTTGWIVVLNGRQARNANVDTSVWVHMVAVYDAASKEVYTYTNGVSSTTWREGTIPNYVDVGRDLRIGNGEVLIDELMVFARALAPTEIAALYDATGANLQTTFADLSELGQYEYTVYAVDGNGDANSISGSVLVDIPDSAPQVTAVSPLTPTHSGDTTQTFTVSVRSTNTDTTLASATLYWDHNQEWGPVGDPIALSGPTDKASFEMSGLTSGKITWNVLVTDSNGNSSFATSNQIIQIGQTDYYVAMDGADSNPGTIDLPFKAIQRFADIALPGDTCWIREGTYRETVAPSNSGNAMAPISFKAYPGETVTISGADVIDGGWTLHDGSIYKTTAMDWDLDGEDRRGRNQVFVGGVATIEARWPNSKDIMRPKWSLMQEGSTAVATDDTWVATIIDEPNLIHPEGYWVGAIMHGAWSYGASTGVVTESVPGKLTVHMPIPVAHAYNMGANTGSPYYLIGVYNALDTEGEWCYSSDESTLYLWPPQGVDLSSALVEARSARQQGFNLSGKSYINIDHINLFACNVLTDAKSSCNIITDMNCQYPTHYWMSRSYAELVEGFCGTGIVLNGCDNILQNSTIQYSAANGVSLLGQNNTIQNCEIGNVNYIVSECGAIGSGDQYSSGNRILGNKLYNSGRSVLVITKAERLRVLYNDIYNNDYGGEVWDLGLIYSIGTRSKGSEIAYNNVHSGYYIGIYFDTDCHGYDVHHNLVWDIKNDHWRYGGTPIGIHMNTPATGNRVAHNTLPNTWTSINTAWDPRTFDGTCIKNNVGLWVHRGFDGTYGLSEATNLNTSYSQRYNPGYANPDHVYLDAPLGVHDRLQQAVIGDSGDFRLRAGTEEEPNPARDAGQDLGYSHDILGNVIAGEPDIGVYEYMGDSAPSNYSLSMWAVHGVVSKSPDSAMYGLGETVTLRAVADDGYVFVGWTGDLSGRTNPAEIVMDEQKFVTARFAEISTNTYSLHTTSTYGGSVVRTPDKTVFRPGETVTLQAVALDGYAFTGWSGSHTGISSPVTVLMDGPKLITANFARTYTLTTSAVHGSVTRIPSKEAYIVGEAVTLLASPESGYAFAGWSGDLSGDFNPASITMDSDKTVRATFASSATPTVVNCSPTADAIQVPVNSLVSLHITDDDPGVDANTVTIAVDGTTVYSGNVGSYNNLGGICRRIGTQADYTYAYQSNRDFDFDQTIMVTANAADLIGNAMPQHSYSFTTAMRAFGPNLEASSELESLGKSSPATARDSSDNIWTVWHAGAPGERDIYVSMLPAGASDFVSPTQLTTSTGDQSEPDIAIDTDDTLYVVWQDNRRGNWDIYTRSSLDGITWSAEARITDSNDNQVSPAIVVDTQVPTGVHVAWQDDGAGHQDIYMASSDGGFATKMVQRVTSDASDQSDPQIAVDSFNTVYLVWTDRRNGSDDIYGASSSAGPWTNVAVVTGPGNQNSAAIAAEAVGSVVHLLWVDDASGNQDVCYASSNALPSTPLTGVSINDDMLDGDQADPSIIIVGSEGAGLRVFACWQDGRNVAVSGGDTDLYFMEIRTGTETNILIGDDRANSGQSEPAIGVQAEGHPYVVWTDDRNVNTDIYWAGSTFMERDAVASQLVTASAGTTVGVVPPSRLEHVSVVIPPNACPYDVTVTIRRMHNLQSDSVPCISSYDFGPSGLDFELPVTITIPYFVEEYGSGPLLPYWHDSRISMPSQNGITDVETLEISPTVRAVRFKTTHFTPYVLLPAPTGDSGGGGGCSLSAYGESDPYGYFAPFVILAIVMGCLRLRGSARYSASRGYPRRGRT